MDERTHAAPALVQELERRITETPPFKEKTFLPEKSDLEPPLSIYEQIRGEPYTVKFFGLTDWLYFMKNPMFDVSGLKDKVSKVENFVINEIKHKGFRDSLESYAAIINNFKQKLKINPLEKSTISFERIHRYISRARGKSAYKK